MRGRDSPLANATSSAAARCPHHGTGANVRRMFFRRVKVGVVTNLHRQQHVDITLLAKDLRLKLTIVSQSCLVGVQQIAERRASFTPFLFAQRGKAVQRIRIKDAFLTKLWQ